MDKAIHTLKQKSSESFLFFIIQLILFHLSSFLLMWITYSKGVSIIVNIVLAVFLVFFVQNGIELNNLMALSENDVTDTDLDAKPV